MESNMSNDIENTAQLQPTTADSVDHAELQAAPNGKRKKLLGMVVGVFAAIGIGYGAYWSIF